MNETLIWGFNDKQPPWFIAYFENFNYLTSSLIKRQIFNILYY